MFFSFLVLVAITLPTFAAESSISVNTVKHYGGTGNDQYRSVTSVENGYVSVRAIRLY